MRALISACIHLCELPISVSSCTAATYSSAETLGSSTPKQIWPPRIAPYSTPKTPLSSHWSFHPDGVLSRRGTVFQHHPQPSLFPFFSAMWLKETGASRPCALSYTTISENVGEVNAMQFLLLNTAAFFGKISSKPTVNQRNTPSQFSS